MQVLDQVDLDAIRALARREEFFWLDLEAPSDADLDALGELLGIPDLAVEDTKEFDQRPKLDDYGERVLIVFYGAHEQRAGRGPRPRLRQRGRHRPPGPVRPPAGRPAKRRGDGAEATEQDLVYRVLDALTDSLRTLADRYAAEVEHLEEVAFERPKPADRRRMSELRSELFRLQQIVIPAARHAGAAAAICSRTCPASSATSRATTSATSTTTCVVTANAIDYLRECSLADDVTSRCINARWPAG